MECHQVALTGGPPPWEMPRGRNSIQCSEVTSVTMIASPMAETPIARAIAMRTMLAIIIAGLLADGQAAAANRCLEPIYTKGTLGTGYWSNSCSTGRNVSWKLENDAGTCRARPYSEFPCAAFVPAHSKVTAPMAGTVTWIECEAKTAVSGPFPFPTDDGRYECRNLQDKAYTRSGSGVLKKESGAIYMGQVPGTAFGVPAQGMQEAERRRKT